MSTPCLHPASVATRVPSASMKASSKKSAGCCFQTLTPGLVEDVLEGLDVVGGEAAAEVAGGGGVGDAVGAEGVEEDLVVAPQFDVLEAGAAGTGGCRRCSGRGRSRGTAGAA